MHGDVMIVSRCFPVASCLSRPLSASKDDPCLDHVFNQPVKIHLLFDLHQ